MKNVELDKNVIITDIEKEYVKEKCYNITTEKYTKKCPICNNIQIYTSPDALRRAIKHNSLCKSCDIIRKNNKVGIKNHFYGKHHTDETKQKISEKRKLQTFSEEARRKIGLAHKNNKYNLGRKCKNSTRLLFSLKRKGKNNANYGGKYSKKGIYHAFYGKHHTDDTKQKMREVVVERIKSYGIHTRNFNPRACKFIDKLNEEKGWSLQHALNGGEYSFLGYFVDGYDKEKNIVFEYDEKFHRNENQKNKDLIKEDRIINFLKPTAFYRYDEMNEELKRIL